MNKMFILFLLMILFFSHLGFSQTDPRDTINIKGLTQEDMVRI